MLATCFSMDSLLASVTHGFLPASKTEYQCLLCEWRLGEGLGERLCSRQWADTPFYDHSAWVCLTSSMSLHLKCNPAYFGLRCLFDLDCRNHAAGCHLQKTGQKMECRRMSVVRGFVYKMNTIGPRTEPCGTPKLSKVGCENLLLMVTEFYWKGRIWTSWEVLLEKFHRGAQVFDRECCDLWCRTQPTGQEKLRHPNTKSSNERLFILTRTHSMQIFGEIPSIKPQNDI